MIFHLFRHNSLYRDEHFAPTALRSHGAVAKVELYDDIREVLDWHYKHTIITSWGGDALKSRLNYFRHPDDESVAWSMDLENESDYSDFEDSLLSSGPFLP